MKVKTEVPKMKSEMKLVLMVAIIALLAVGVGKAEAYSMNLHDNPFEEDFKSYATASGGMYRFTFSYWIYTESVDDLGKATNHDAFVYALMTSGSEYDTSDSIGFFNTGDYTTLIDNSDAVDIFGADLQSQPMTVVKEFIADKFLYPYFSVGDGNETYDATVHIEYQLQRLDVSAVPEPSTFLLVSAGLLGLIGVLNRRCTRSPKQ